jgi:hypothetical protein
LAWLLLICSSARNRSARVAMSVSLLFAPSLVDVENFNTCLLGDVADLICPVASALPRSVNRGSPSRGTC